MSANHSYYYLSNTIYTMYHYTIWLEVHIKLSTTHKLFCSCENTQEFDATSPNSHICPTCTAQPGSLPIINNDCIDTAIRLWTIFSSTLQKNFSWDRKSYFYADSPLWFQITQFHTPIIKDWKVNFWRDNFQTEDSIGIHEAHLENDTAKTITIDNDTFIDFNRSGSPLIEIVTKPEFTNDDQVIEFLKELQRVVKWNNIGYADLEKGQMRVDVNISIKDTNSEQLGRRVEVKNINSYAAIRKAIQYEFSRQKEIVEWWWVVDQETRRRDDSSQTTQSMRSKEQAMDYRYFPECNLPLIDPAERERNPSFEVRTWYQRIQRLKWYWFHKEFIYGLINSELLRDWFERWLKQWHEPKSVAKRLMGQLSNTINTSWEQSLPLTGDQFVEFLDHIKEWWYSDSISKQIMEEILSLESRQKSIKEIVDRHSWSTIDEETIREYVKQILQEQTSTVVLYKWWKTTTLWFFVWQLMKKTGWTVDPNQAKTLFEEELGKL